LRNPTTTSPRSATQVVCWFDVHAATTAARWAAGRPPRIECAVDIPVECGAERVEDRRPREQRELHNRVEVPALERGDPNFHGFILLSCMRRRDE
jgi:hypothetical protein